MERFLVTGALGCLGAWTLRTLLDEGVEAIGFDVSCDTARLSLLMDEEERATVTLIQGDLTDATAVEALFAEHRPTHLVHLAALQVPFCRADPSRGARVNVEGTVNLFEAAGRHGVSGISYASSIAVFGPPDRYPEGAVSDDSRPHPETLYGVYKMADEGVARVYAADHGVPSVGLRPYVVYGPGRDQGLTSEATTAMLAAAAGRPYRIGHGGTLVFHHAPDVARLFVRAARAHPAGAVVHNAGGSTASVPEVIGAIEETVPAARGSIGFEDRPLPFPTAVDASGLEQTLGPVRYTPLSQGVRATVEAFRRLLERGLITPPES